MTDFHLQGEFIPRKSPSHHSSLPIPSFSGASDNRKMLYFWITDYTLNTAGEVYHNAGFLHLKITDKSKVNRVSCVFYPLDGKKINLA